MSKLKSDPEYIRKANERWLKRSKPIKYEGKKLREQMANEFRLFRLKNPKHLECDRDV